MTNEDLILSIAAKIYAKGVEAVLKDFYFKNDILNTEQETTEIASKWLNAITSRRGDMFFAVGKILQEQDNSNE